MVEEVRQLITALDERHREQLKSQREEMAALLDRLGPTGPRKKLDPKAFRMSMFSGSGSAADNFDEWSFQVKCVIRSQQPKLYDMMIMIESGGEIGDEATAPDAEKQLSFLFGTWLNLASSLFIQNV